jgi:Holliday junction resolvase RusA-like endonuclease
MIESGSLIASAEIPGLPPSVNGIWKVRRRGIYKSKKARVWQEVASWELAMGRKKRGEPYCGPASFLMVVLARSIGRRRDIDNMGKCAHDAAQRAGVFKDDSQVQDFRAVRIFTGQADKTAIYVWAGERLPDDDVRQVIKAFDKPLCTDL